MTQPVRVWVTALGCVSRIALGIGIVAAVATAWFWSQGLDLRAAVEQGFITAAWVCLLPAAGLLLAGAVAALAVLVWGRP